MHETKKIYFQNPSDQGAGLNETQHHNRIRPIQPPTPGQPQDPGRRSFLGLAGLLGLAAGGSLGFIAGRVTAPNENGTLVGQPDNNESNNEIKELNQRIVDLSIENGKLSGEVAVYETVLKDHGIAEVPSDEQEKIKLAMELFTALQGFGLTYQGNGEFITNDGVKLHIDSFSRDECLEGFEIERATLNLKGEACGTPTVTPTASSISGLETVTPFSTSSPTPTEFQQTLPPPPSTEVQATATVVPAPTNVDAPIPVNTQQPAPPSVNTPTMAP